MQSDGKSSSEEVSNPAITSLAHSATDRVRELDGIRGIAILMILVWHYVFNRFSPPLESASGIGHLWRLLALTWSGVDLFFVLSGFLIGGILLHNRDSSSYFKTFYIRRFCRIVPVYFLLLLGFWVASSAGLEQRDPAWKWLLANPMPPLSYPLFLQNFYMFRRGDFGALGLAVTWSLAIEEQFYLVLPWIVRYVPRKKLCYVLFGLIAIAPIFRILLFVFHGSLNPAAGGFFLMPGRLDALGLGALAAYGMQSPRFVTLLRNHSTRLLALFGLLLAGYFVMSFVTPDLLSAQITWWGHSWLALLFVTFLICPLIHGGSRWLAVLRLPALRKLGIISYSVYLFHLPIIYLLDALMFRAKWQTDLGLHLVMAGMAVAVTVLLAAGLYRFVERPFIEFGHRFRY